MAEERSNMVSATAEIPLSSITVPIPEDLPPAYFSDDAPPPPPPPALPAPSATSVGHIHLVTPRSSQLPVRVTTEPHVAPPPPFISPQDDALPNYLDATCSNTDGIPWSLPSNGTITFTILPHCTVPFQPPQPPSSAAGTTGSPYNPSLTNQAISFHESVVGQQPSQQSNAQAASSMDASARTTDHPHQGTETDRPREVEGEAEEDEEEEEEEEEEDGELQVIAKQRIRHPNRHRRTDTAPPPLPPPPTPQQHIQPQMDAHVQTQPGLDHAPLNQQQEGSPSESTPTAMATTPATRSPIVLETIRMRRDGLWAFEYWVEDAILYMLFPVKQKQHSSPRHPRHRRRHLGPGVLDHSQRQSSNSRSFYPNDDSLEVRRASYESISDLPTPAPLTSPLSYSSSHHTPSQDRTMATNYDRLNTSLGVFGGGSALAASLAHSSSTQDHRRHPGGGGFMSQTFSSASSSGPSSSAAAGGASASWSSSSPIPPHANLFALVSASDPQACLWRSTCFGEHLERCVQLCTNEDIMMWWRERIDQTYEFGRQLDRPAPQSTALGPSRSQQRASGQTDLEAGHPDPAIATTTTTTINNNNTSNLDNTTSLPTWRRWRAYIATRTQALVQSHHGTQANTTTTDANGGGGGGGGAVHASQGSIKKRKKKRSPFFDKRDWEQGFWHGVKVMLVKSGVREIPAPHNETMEMTMRVRGLYYCWREVTFTHLDSDDEDDGDEEHVQARNNTQDDDLMASLQSSTSLNRTGGTRRQHRHQNYGGRGRGRDVIELSPSTTSSSSSPSTQSRLASGQTSVVSNLSVRDAMQRARNERRRRGKGRGHARMFVFERDDALVNGKRIRGMIVAEIWIGHRDPTPQEVEEERLLEIRRRRQRRQLREQLHADQWATAITGVAAATTGATTTTTTSTTAAHENHQALSRSHSSLPSQSCLNDSSPPRPSESDVATTTLAGSGSGDPFPSALKRRRCMLRVRQGLSADVESFILTTGPRLPEMYEVFDQESYRPRVSRCRVMLYSCITTSIFAAVFFTKLSSIS